MTVMMEDNSFQVDSQTKVVVYSLEYLRRLVKLLSKTPKRFVVKGKTDFLNAHDETTQYVHFVCSVVRQARLHFQFRLQHLMRSFIIFPVSRCNVKTNVVRKKNKKILNQRRLNPLIMILTASYKSEKYGLPSTSMT